MPILNNNDGSNNSRETPRRNTPMCGSDNVEDEHKTSPNRIINMPMSMNIRQSLQILCCEEKDDVKEVKRSHGLQVREYHPYK